LTLGIAGITLYCMLDNYKEKDWSEVFKADTSDSISNGSPGKLFSNTGNRDDTRYQFYAFHFAVLVWTLSFLVWYSNRKSQTSLDLDAINVTAADYAIQVKDLPPSTTAEDIIQHFNRPEYKNLYRQVAEYIDERVSLGLAPQGTEPEDLKLWLERAKVMADNIRHHVDDEDGLLVKAMCNPMVDLREQLEAHIEMQRLEVVVGQLQQQVAEISIVGKDVHKNPEELDKELKVAQEELQMQIEKHEAACAKQSEIRKANGSLPCTGYAFVVFKYMALADAVNQWHNMSNEDTLRTYCGGCMKPRFGAYANWPPSEIGTAEGGFKFSVDDAPEPEEIYWQNMSFTKKERRNRQIWSYLLSSVLILIAGGIIWGIETAKQDQIDYSSFKESNYSDGYVQAVGIFAALFTVIINAVLGEACSYFTNQENHKTRTDHLISLIWKRTGMYFINTVLVYYVINNNPSGYGGTGSRTGWYDGGGLATQAWYLAVTNALVWPLLQASNYIGYLSWCYFKRTASTQVELNMAYEPPEFDLAESYAAMLKTFALGLYFLPLMPSIIYPTLLALVLQYATNKFVLLRYSKRPPAYNDKVKHVSRRLMFLILVGYLVILPCVFGGANLKESESKSTVNTGDDTWFSGPHWWVGFVTMHCLVFFLFLVCPCTRYGSAALREAALELGQGEKDKFPESNEQLQAKEMQSGPGSWQYIIPTQQNLERMLAQGINTKFSNTDFNTDTAPIRPPDLPSFQGHWPSDQPSSAVVSGNRFYMQPATSPAVGDTDVHINMSHVVNPDHDPQYLEPA